MKWCRCRWGEPEPIHPEELWSWEAYQQGEVRLLASLKEHTCTCEKGSALEGDVDSFNTNISKYHIPPHATCRGCTLPKGVLEDGLHMLVRSSTEKEGKAVLDEYHRIKPILQGQCQCYARKYFKKRTGILKMGGKNINKFWRSFCYWEMLYGYMRYQGVDSMEDEVREWLVKTRTLGGPLDEDTYMEMLIEEFANNLDKDWKRPETLPTLDEWIAGGKWMRGKAGTGNATSVDIDGTSKRTRKMKGVEASYLDDRSIKGRILRVNQEEFHVMEKSEGAKVRPVVKTGNELFRKMDFLSEWLEVGLYGATSSTLYADTAQLEEIDKEILATTQDPNIYKVPMDQSNFDWHQNYRSVLALMYVIGLHLIINKAPEEYLAVWEVTWDSLFNESVVVVMGVLRMIWGNGIPSGLRWTALLDTELNRGSFGVTVKIAQNILRRPITIRCAKFQGDDISYATYLLEHIKWILHVYNQLGYEAHPSKTFISKERTEFLRRSYEADTGIIGYNVRTLLALRFRNPILQSPIVRSLRLYSRLTLWHLLTLRGALGKPVGEMFLEDAEQLGIRRETTAGFALCPAAFGGGGLDDYSGMAQALLPYFKGYYVPHVTQEYKRLKPALGKWTERIREWSDHLENDQLEKFQRVLVQSWGITERDITSKVDVKWDKIEKTPIRTPPPLTQMVKPDELWDLAKIPAMLRPHVKEGAMHKGTWRELVKPEYVDYLERYSKRVSKNVFQAYACGYISVSWPIVDSIAMKYGYQIKQKYEKKILQMLWQKDLGISLCKSYLGYYEKQIAKELKQFSLHLTMGV